MEISVIKSVSLAAAVAAVVASAFLAGCSDEPPSLVSREDVISKARAFNDAWVRGDVTALIPQCRLPFRYKDKKRVWASEDDLKLNLQKEVVRTQHLLKGLDQFEAFSRQDLMDGKWPRAREIDAAKRETEIREIGVEVGGWIVRVFAEGKPGYTIVFNADGVSQVRAQVVDI